MLLRRLAIIVAILFFGIQFIRPELRTSPVSRDIKTVQPVKQILRNACYDCHSNETRLPWFDRIVPAYWLVVADVKQARHTLNFSELDRLPAAQLKPILFEAVRQIDFGAMPPKSYALLHPESRVTPDQVAV